MSKASRFMAHKQASCGRGMDSGGRRCSGALPGLGVKYHDRESRMDSPGRNENLDFLSF